MRVPFERLRPRKGVDATLRFPGGDATTRLAAFVLVAAVLHGQPLKVYSEFQRIDAQGQVAAPDRQERSREILSPAVARNAYASFRLAVRLPSGEPYTLYVGQNPENAVRVTLYREEADGASIPDRLAPVGQPAAGKFHTGQAVHTYWMDLWVAADAEVRRIKVELQLHCFSGWVVYPMEVRVMPAIVPPPASSGGPLPPRSSPADASVLGPLREYLCGDSAPGAPRQLTVRGLLRRNALQDIALARQRERGYGREETLRKISAAGGIGDLGGWCGRQAVVPPPPGPEWYLKIRDLLNHGW